MAGSIEIKTLSYPDDRSLTLLANFVDGFAAGWFFAVPEAFKDALDIRFGPRVLSKQQDEKQEKLHLWTQGNKFSFSPGDILYDSKSAYFEENGAPLPWSAALNVINLCLEVESATPAGWVPSKAFSTRFSTEYLEGHRLEDLNPDKPKKERAGKEGKGSLLVAKTKLSVQRFLRNPGRISFSVHGPDAKREKLEPLGRFETTQDFFITYLQTGCLRAPSGTVVEVVPQTKAK
jgi:hypothetical protein